MRSRTLALVAVLVLILSSTIITAAVEPEPGPFHDTWARTDQPVKSGQASRTWMWGPQANTGAMSEPYAEAPGGQRNVQYFDKSRMEITDPAGDASSPWYVTNGLLVVELMTGQMQTGNNTFESRTPSTLNAAGDQGDLNGITYQKLAGLRDADPYTDGATITSVVSHDGPVTDDPSLVARGVTAGPIAENTNHRTASVFWDFMNSEGLIIEGDQMVTGKLFENPYFATGLPITEAYWAKIQVGGTQKLVLIQAFERRVLTYTPDNPAGWQVEAGNVGQHYYQWRYDEPPTTPTPPPSQNGEIGLVTHVVDGDTFDVEINGEVYRVRMIGVDTPETYGGVECYGPEASEATKNLIEGKQVRLVKDVSETDRYGRLLRYVYQDDIFVNLWLVRNGFAYASTYPPDVAHSQEFAEAQSQAQAEGLGLWAGCESTPEPTPQPTPPPEPTPPPSQGCHPSYPDHCIEPPPPDLDCPDLPSSWKPIRVLHNVPDPDPHGFDGNQDGWGCESG